jgi:hypothetical protein
VVRSSMMKPRTVSKSTLNDSPPMVMGPNQRDSLLSVKPSPAAARFSSAA